MSNHHSTSDPPSLPSLELSTGDSILADFQAKMDSILAQADHPTQPPPQPSTASPPITKCQGPTPLPNSNWHGWPDCTICPSCFSSFAADTKLASTMPLQGIFEASACTCDMYSPRQRERYLSACKTGDVEGFLTACRERGVIWGETVGVLLQQRQKGKAERELAQAKAEIMMASAGANRVMEGYAGMGSLGEEKREEYWTESGGVHSSWNGVVAEREEGEADALWAEAVAGDGKGLSEEEVARLEARWAEVE